MSYHETMERGAKIVWTIKRAGVTHGLSEAHRYMIGGETYCRKRLPTDSARLVDTTIIAVADCDRCKVLHESGASVAEVLRQVVEDAMEHIRGAA